MVIVVGKVSAVHWRPCVLLHFPHFSFTTLLSFHIPASFSTLLIFHTSHLPHFSFTTLLSFHTPTSFSTLLIYHTSHLPHSRPHFPHFSFTTLLSFHTPASFSTLLIFHASHFPHAAFFHILRIHFHSPQSPLRNSHIPPNQEIRKDWPLNILLRKILRSKME